MKTIARKILITGLLIFSFQNLYSKDCFPHMTINGTMFIWIPYKDTAISQGVSLLLQANMASMCQTGNSCCCTFNYSWYKDSILVSNANSYSAIDSGYYMCNTFYQNCDGDTMPFSYTVHITYLSSPTGINPIASASGFMITPNPFSQEISLSYEDENDKLKSLKIINSTGKLSKYITCCFHQLEMKKAESGIYFYEAITEKGKIFRGRFLKAK